MRKFLACATALVAVSAWAAGGKDESNKGDRSAGSVSAGPSGSGSDTVAGTADATDTQTKNRDRLLDSVDSKRWEALVGYELHRMFIQTDLGGDAPNKLFNYYYAAFRFDVTKHDRLRVRLGVYERFIADPGETGLRTDDLSFSYTRIIDSLPWGLNVTPTVGLTAPISFYSQKAGLAITAPSLSLDISKQFFGLVTFALRPFGVAYIQKYNANVGGDPNPIARIGISADVYADMPFLPALSLGFDAYTGYSWYYMPTGVLPAPNFYGTTEDATYPTQPVQQSYGGEVYVRYAIPEIVGIKADVTIAVADGDPTLGYSSRLHDGQAYFYGFYRHTAEMYGNLTVRY